MGLSLFLISPLVHLALFIVQQVYPKCCYNPECSLLEEEQKANHVHNIETLYQYLSVKSAYQLGYKVTNMCNLELRLHYKVEVKKDLFGQ